MGAAMLGAIAQMVASVAILITVVRGQRTTHSLVRTMNGKTIGALADLAEGRRIELDVPADERSASQRHYVENVEVDREDPTT